MIHTDGIQTIANAEVRQASEEIPALAAWENNNTLLEREAASLTVSVAYLPITGLVTLTVRCGDETVAHTIAPQNALDAFHHPTLYLSPEQVERLGL